MAEQEYRVRLTADTKQATDKLDAVTNTLSGLTSKSHDIRVNVDANALTRASADTQEIANTIRSTKLDLKEASGINIISGNSLSAATDLAGKLYGMRATAKGLGVDLEQALKKTNVSEFMRTDQFLNRVLENAKGNSRKIVESYQAVREIPGTDELLGPLENYGRSAVFQNFGTEIAEQTLQGVTQGLQESVKATKGFFYADLLDEIAVGANNTIDTLARVGLAIQGVQLLVGPLAATWSAAFDSIIGQNVRLEQTILSTQTTLASTARVFANGIEVLDPLQKIEALEGDVRRAIENIRVRSLELAGVTSQQIIEIFGVVANSIGQVGGSIKDAEDLAISFTAALGTLGIPFYQASQEIGSVLGGYITEDSLLAKKLQISNKDINKAKGSIDGVAGYLQKKLEVAVAGQSIQAQGFGGVMSNIQEIFEVLGQEIGQPLLKPIVSGLTVIYNFLSKIKGIVIEVGTFVSKSIASTITSIASIFANTKLAESISRFSDQLSEPYERLRRSLELGFGEQGTNLLEQWITSSERVPSAMQGVVAALQSFGNFLRLQIDLITAPLQQLIDQSRELRGAGDIAGIAQGIARVGSAPFGNIIEGADLFTKGWDTIGSTIEYAAKALSKFILAVAQLKITELTASIRAAASVFEIFGSVILGKINLALSFFDFLGNVASTDIAKFLVSMNAINKLVNSTDFFGIKGLAIWATQTRVILSQLAGDIQLFVRGFKDASNVQNLIGNTQAAYAKVFNLGAKSGNTVIQNSAAIEQMTQRIASLNAMQQQMAAQGAGAVAMDRYSGAIRQANEQLAGLKKTQQEFTNVQRAGAALKSVLGGGAEMAQAQEAARQASVMASGAASAHALRGAMDALATKLGMTREQFASLTGVAGAAGKSIKTFVTTTMAINLAFGVLSLAISGIIALWQGYEERARAARLESQATAAVLRVLGKEYTGLIKAAEGGDIAAKNLLNAEREQVQAKVQIQAEKLAKISEKQTDINNKLAVSQSKVNELRRRGVQLAGRNEGVAGNSQDELRFHLEKINVLNKDRNKLSAEHNRQLQEQLQAQEALQKLEGQEASRRQVEILAQDRKDIEEKIKLFREDLGKEINDKEFQQRMELLNQEQQVRTEQIQRQKAALASEFELIRSNSTERNQASLKLIEDYKQGLLDATESEERRRTELVQAEARMRKDIEDYAFKIGRQRAELEKTIGKYKQAVQKEINKEQEYADQRALVQAKKRQAIASAFFRPFSAEQNQKFINYTQGNNPLGKKYSLEMAYGIGQLYSKDQLGLSGLESGEYIAQKIITNIEAFNKQGISTLPQLVKNVFPDMSEAMVDATVRALRSEQNNRLGIEQLRNPNPPIIQQKEFDSNYQRDLAQAEAESQRLATEQLASFKEVLKAQQQSETDKLQRLLNTFANPSRFGDIKSSYATDIDANVRYLKASNQALLDFTQGIQNADAEIAKAETVLRTDLFNIIKSTGTKMSDTQINDDIEYILRQVAEKGSIPKTGIPKADAAYSMIQKSIEGFEAYKKQAIANTSPANIANQGQALNQALDTALGASTLLTSRTEKVSSAFQQFTSIVEQGSSATYSLFQAQVKAQRFVELEISKIAASQKSPLSAEQLAGIEKRGRIMVDALIAQERAMQPVNEALQAFADRMSMAVQMTDNVISANKTFMQSVLTNSQTLKEAALQLSTSISEEFVSMLLDQALRPMRDQLLERMKKLFGVQSAEDRAKSAMDALAASQTTLGQKTDQLKDAVSNNTTALTAIAAGIGGPDLNANTSGLSYGIRIGDTVGSLTPRKQAPATDTSLPTLTGSESEYEMMTRLGNLGPDYVTEIEGMLEQSFKGIGESLTQFGTKAKTAGDIGEKGFTKFLGGMMGVATGALAITGAIQAMQDSESGTYGTLMGIAGILGGLGAIAGGVGGIMKARGGPVSARRPYIVGEVGPELFIPDAGGTIIPNDQIAFTGAGGATAESGSSGMTVPFQQGGSSVSNAFSTINSTAIPFTKSTERMVAERSERETIAAINNPKPLDVRYESSVINNVEYVTAEQHQKGMAEAAERGRTLTLSALQNSIKSRRQVGLV